MNAEDLAKVVELLKFRLPQFRVFPKALVGPEEMKNMMLKAISVAGRIG